MVLLEACQDVVVVVVDVQDGWVAYTGDVAYAVVGEVDPDNSILQGSMASGTYPVGTPAAFKYQ